MLRNYTAEELVDQVAAEGFWWADEDDDIVSVKVRNGAIVVRLWDAANPGFHRVEELRGVQLREAARAFCRQYPGSVVAGWLRGGDLDAEGSSVIAQVAVFGEVVYG